MDIKDLYLATIDSLKSHRKQRMDNFNFFVVFSGLLTNATVLCLKEGFAQNRSLFFVATLISIAQIIVALLFFLGDFRVSKTILYTHNMIEEIEQTFDIKPYTNIANQFKKTKSFPLVRITAVLRTIFALFIAFGMTTFVISILFGTQCL